MKTHEDCGHCGGFGETTGEYPGAECSACCGTGKAPVKESLTTEQPEDGPVAWGVEFKGKPYRNVRPSYERDSIAKLTEGNDGVRIAPFYPASVKAERDALREHVEMLQNTCAIHKVTNKGLSKQLGALRERVKELEAGLKKYGSHQSDDFGAICEWLKDARRPCTCGLHAAMQEGKS